MFFLGRLAHDPDRSAAARATPPFAGVVGPSAKVGTTGVTGNRNIGDGCHERNLGGRKHAQMA